MQQKKGKQAIASKLGVKKNSGVVKKSKAAAGKATTLAGKASEAAQRVATAAQGAAATAATTAQDAVTAVKDAAANALLSAQKVSLASLLCLLTSIALHPLHIVACFCRAQQISTMLCTDSAAFTRSMLCVAPLPNTCLPVMVIATAHFLSVLCLMLNMAQTK